jgi:type IV secretion system protein TrbB
LRRKIFESKKVISAQLRPACQSVSWPEKNKMNLQTAQTATASDPIQAVTLASLEHGGWMTEVERAIAEKSNMLLVGPTGSGKTTWMSALASGVIQHDHVARIAIVATVREIPAFTQNVVHLLANPDIGRAKQIDDAAKNFDRIIVDDVHGSEAFSLLRAWKGVKGGFAAMHAGTPQQAVQRLALLASQHADAEGDLTAAVVDAVDLIVQVDRKLVNITRVRDIVGA